MKRTKVCQHCDGTGRVYDDKAIGQELRALRESKGLMGREIARRMGYSAMYLCDLEHGRRAWSTDKIQSYRRAVEV